jgi:hypothetical protein
MPTRKRMTLVAVFPLLTVLVNPTVDVLIPPWGCSMIHGEGERQCQRPAFHF